MNIFILDEDPIVAAGYYPDKLIVKIPIEIAQIMSTVSKQLNHDHQYYKETHKNHPIMKWAKKNRFNWIWMYHHGIELCKEYTRRYGRRHACHDMIEGLKTLGPVNVENEVRFVQCMPEKYKIPGDPVQAYRNYCIAEKSYYAKWKLGNRPTWWKV